MSDSQANRANKKGKLRRAVKNFDRAEELAKSRGLLLRKCNEHHYQLSSKEWLVNLYPSTGRVHVDQNKLRINFDVKGNWTLLDAVKYGAYKVHLKRVMVKRSQDKRKARDECCMD